MERNGERGEENERAGRGMIRQYPSRHGSAGAGIYNGAAARTGRGGDDGKRMDKPGGKGDGTSYRGDHRGNKKFRNL